MGKNEGFKVEITSDFADFSRYNVAVTCGCFDEKGERIAFVSAEDTIAPVGSERVAAPKGRSSKRLISFETDECHHLQMYIYLIPYTTPSGRDVGDYKPFSLDVRVARGGRVVLKQQYSVNQWSGASIELKVGE